MTFVLTPAGLTTEDVTEARIDLVARAKVHFGAGVDTKSGSFIGDMISLFLQRYVSIQQAALDLYNSFSRTAAEAAALDNLASLIGVSRLLPLPSTAPGLITGVPATSVPAGSRVRIPGGTFWIIQETTVIGGAPTAVVLESEDDGAVEALTGEISEIVDSVIGWATVTNTDDASVGRLLETDAILRIRMENSLGVGTSSSEGAIRSALELEDNELKLTHVSVTSNRTNFTNADGLPPHTYRAVILPSTADIQAVAEVLWVVQGAGIDSFGTTVVIVVDDQGNDQPVRFTFATETDFWVDVTLTKKLVGYPADGDDQVKQAVLDWSLGIGEGNVALVAGEDVYPKQIECAILAAVAGLQDVDITVGTAPAPINTLPVVVASNEIARFATARVTIL